MGRSRRGDSRQMGDADDLPFAGDLPHFLSHNPGGFSSDICVDLVEDQDRHFVLGGQDRLEAQHHTRHFAGGRNRPQRTSGFAGIGSEEELDFVKTAGTIFAVAGRGFTAEVDLEKALLKPQFAQLRRDGPGEFGNYFPTLCGKLCAGLLEFPACLFQGSVEAGDFAIPLFERLKFAGRFRAEGNHVLERWAVLSFQRLHEIQTIFQLLQALRVKVEPFRVPA
jgi:hypothetical protein